MPTSVTKTIILQPTRTQPPSEQSSFEQTNNKYVLKKNNKPYIDLDKVERLVLPLSSPVVKSNGVHKQLATKLFLYDKAWGWEFFAKRLDLNQQSIITIQSS